MLVTGASGFVGTGLVRRLLAEGVAIRGTCRLQTPHLRGVEWRVVSQLDYADQWAELLVDVDVVVHLAALAHQIGRAAAGRSQEYLRVNVDGTRVIARACRTAGVRRLVFVSSIAAVCARSEIPVDDLTAPAPQDDYGRSKLSAEDALQSELLDADTDWCILRPPLVYGPGNPGNMRRLLALTATGLPLPFGSIRNRRSFMFLDNLVDAILTVIRYPGDIRAAYVLADGSDFTTPELIAALASAAGRTPRIVRVPISMLRLAARIGDVAGRLLPTSPGFDSYSVERLVSSLPVNGERFCEFFKWRAPVARARAVWLTCNNPAGIDRSDS